MYNELLKMLNEHNLYVEVTNFRTTDYKILNVYFKKPSKIRQMIYFRDDDFHIHARLNENAITVYYPNKKDRTRKFVKNFATELSNKFNISVIVEDELDNVLVYKDGKSRKLGGKFAN